MRAALLLAVLLATLAAAPAAAWQEVPFRTLPGGNVATCLRGTGVEGGLVALGPLGRRTAPADLLAVGTGRPGVRERVRFGVAIRCPAVQERDGAGVAAAPVGRLGTKVLDMQAAIRDPGGAFGRPVRLGRVAFAGSASFATAVSGSGHALVAWLQTDRRGIRTRARLVAARRVPGAGFAPREVLTPWRQVGRSEPPAVAAGVDPEGRATVVWARASVSAKPEGSGVVEVTSAPAAERFGPARKLAQIAQIPERLSLAVAAGGAALLAHDSFEGIQLYERAAGAAGFGPARLLERTRPLESTGEPALALRDDGAAVLGWRQDVGVRAMTRAASGPFGPARDVAPGREGSDFGSGLQAFFGIGSFDRTIAPVDLENTGLQAALSDTGRIALAWTTTRRVPDAPLAPMAATGTLEGGFGAPAVLGSAARAANGVAAVLLPGGEPAAAWVDNVPDPFGFGSGEAENAARGGRIHLARADAVPAVPAPAPPAVLRAPRVQRLIEDEPVRATLRCRSACDARVYIRSGGQAAAGDAASVPAGRRVPLRLHALGNLDDGGLGQLGRTTLRARISAPGSAATRTLRVRSRLAQRPGPPIPPIVDARAIRRGRAVVVTWRTAFPARGVSFSVRPASRRPLTDPGTLASPEGRGRTHFRVTLRPERPNALRRLLISASGRGSRRARSVTVPVTG